MSDTSAALDEIKSFVSNTRVEPSGADFDSVEARRIYRLFHALLIWEIVIDRDTTHPVVRLYFREALSDLATSYLLNFLGLYKSARLSYRGAIENIVRVFAASASVDVLSINSIPTLINRCQDAWASTPAKVQRLNSLYVIYGELCNTVHSTSVDYMSLKVPFQTLLTQDSEEFRLNMTIFDKLLKEMGEALYLTFHAILASIEFKNADYISDSLTADAKKAVLEV